MTLSFNQISLEQFYGGKEPFEEPEGRIVFKRVEQCSQTGITYNQ